MSDLYEAIFEFLFEVIFEVVTKNRIRMMISALIALTLCGGLYVFFFTEIGL